MKAKNLRFLIVGEGRFHTYEVALAEQLKLLGHQSKVLGWHEFFTTKQTENVEFAHYRSIFHRISQRLAAGPPNQAFNRAVVSSAAEFSPDVIFLYNAKQVRPSTVQRLRIQNPKAAIVQFNNDNPFSRKATWSRWRHVRGTVPHVDLALAYRPSNLNQLAIRGAKEVALWRAACSLDDFSVNTSDASRDIDILFAGHYEDDGRDLLLERLLRAGLDVRVHGGHWRTWAKSKRARGTLLSQQDLQPLFGSDYRTTLARAKVALCFLSSLNEDSYTRRSFEIPATGTAQLSQYSTDLSSLFEENREIVFFRSAAELVEKSQLLLTNHEWRESLAERGRQRVISDGHDMRSRTSELIDLVGITLEGKKVR